MWCAGGGCAIGNFGGDEQTRRLMIPAGMRFELSLIGGAESRVTVAGVDRFLLCRYSLRMLELAQRRALEIMTWSGKPRVGVVGGRI